MTTSPPRLSLTQLLVCGASVVTISMGVRHGFGLWLQPIIQANGWTRETFSFAIAVQNLVWGFAGIFAGMAADRLGASRVLVIGAIFYAVGLFGMGHSNTPLWFMLSTGVMIGIAQAGTTYAVVYGIIGRNVPVQKRSWAMGVTAAAGSFGQFLMLPTEGFLISHVGWQESLTLLGASALLIIPLAWWLREPGFGAAATPVARQQTIGQAFMEALKYPSFQLLMAGYFVCGFHLVFIGIHLPGYLADKGLTGEVAGYGLALVGLFNIVGSYAAGVLGQKFAKRKILACIYFARAVVIAGFVAAPVSALSVYVFCSLMGVLWLSTVPVTTGTVAHIFGVEHLSMLSGFVFFSHQVGSFTGVWLAGRLRDSTGSYDVMWYITIALGVFAALINLPVREAAIERRPQSLAGGHA